MFKAVISFSALVGAVFLSAPLLAADVGCVSTTFKFLGPNDKICIDSFADPKVEGVVCHVSRAKTGGMSGLVGIAEDTSDASISCSQVGPIVIKQDLAEGENVFKESRSWLFKRLQVVRFHDQPNRALVYLTYSDKLVDGSPQNSISVVPIKPWISEKAAAWIETQSSK